MGRFAFAPSRQFTRRSSLAACLILIMTAVPANANATLGSPQLKSPNLVNSSSDGNESKSGCPNPGSLNTWAFPKFPSQTGAL